ncbi:MAG: Crp/Fnr family transcriptional regulator [Bacteroidales bacterium]|nr:Crp/Fnr family transcriptional regulator [Bacteroidales bacterium]
MSLVLLKKKISEVISLNKEDHELIETYFKPLKVEKNIRLIEPGTPVRLAYFINSGYIRYYKYLESGEELIIHLYAANNFATSLNSFFSNLPSCEVMQTLTECELLTITKDDLEKLYSTNQKWQYFGRKLMEGFLIEKEQRIIDQISLSGQEKYLKLFKTNPDIIQNVQVKYLASFLGLQPESLSRIKKHIN